VPLSAGETASGVWFDNTAQLAWLAGSLLNGSTSSPRVWTIDGANTVSSLQLGLLPGGSNAVGVRFSEDGQYVVGFGDSSSGSSAKPARWTKGAWNTPQGTGQLPGVTDSQGTGVSTSGTVVGPSSAATVWTSTNGLLALPGIPGLFANLGTSFDISSTAAVIVGSAVWPDGSVGAAQWQQGGSGYEINLLASPYSKTSATFCVSPDGHLVGGIMPHASGTTVACIWEDGGLFTLRDGTGANLPGGVTATTDDGAAFGYGNFGGLQQATLWHPALGQDAIALDDYYTLHAGVAPPTSFQLIQYGIAVNDSYHLVVYGDNGLSYYVAVPSVSSSGGWHNAGPGSPGISGTPWLSGRGSLSANSSVALDLINASPSSPGFLVFGIAAIHTPFKNGVMVPAVTAPSGTFLPLMTNSAGGVSLSGTWPVGVPSGLTTWSQYWIVDATQLSGFSSSNALASTMP
jgi:hypothetical protein